MSVTRSVLGLIGMLAVLATLWLTLIAGSGSAPTVTPGATTAPSGATIGTTAANGYSSAIGAARQTDQAAQSANGSTAGSP